ncbi:Olfactory receptor 4X2, partial [Ophiophagus hannah]
MAETKEENQTEIKEFHLMGFVGLRDLQVLLFCLFLVIYIATMVGIILNSGAFVQSVDIQSTKQENRERKRKPQGHNMYELVNMEKREQKNLTDIMEFHLLKFCGPSEINHFFCELNPIIKLACSDTHLIELVTILISVHNDDCLHIAQNRWIVRHQQSLVSVLYNPDFFYTT